MRASNHGCLQPRYSGYYPLSLHDALPILTAVGADAVGALGKDHVRSAPLDERHEHGCPDERPRVDDPPLTRREPLPGARHELVEGHHDMKKPPSTLSAWPVTPADSGSARNTAAWASSSASIMRRCGTRRL